MAVFTVTAVVYFTATSKIVLPLWLYAILGVEAAIDLLSGFKVFRKGGS